MKPVRMISIAEQEMLEAAAYYERQAQGLGLNFYDQVEKATIEISCGPETWPVVFKTTRKHVIDRFPFFLLYRDDPEEIVIQAVMHTSRNPTRWQKRV